MSHLTLPDLRTTSFEYFMGNARKIVETIYSVTLEGFKSAVVQCERHSEVEANNALDWALEAGKLHQMGNYNGAEEMAKKAQETVRNMLVL